jgi:ABC-type nitrate/sulfonate/bicarbonate transport system ATPase subunit
MTAGPILSIEALHKHFRTNNGAPVEALSEVTFDVPENDFVCIVGPSGCGKSTLLRVIAGLETATAGRIDYRGDTVSRPRREIGMVFSGILAPPLETRP